jgi:hypothetical protein
LLIQKKLNSRYYRLAEQAGGSAAAEIWLPRYRTDKALYTYVMVEEQLYACPPQQVLFDNDIRAIQRALGLHTAISRVQGGRLKAKNEIRIASLFKEVPLEFLRMIVVHELAHLKEKDHNRAFYKLCLSMEPDYHQIEFDLRLYLTHIDLAGRLEWTRPA